MIASVKKILDFINMHLPVHAIAEEINFKAEVILIELLTNAIKHTTDAEVFMQVFIYGESLIIEKTDFSSPFDPDNIILANNTGCRVSISKDSLHTIYAIVESESRIRFVCEENSDTGILDVNNVMEHFGLLIITKSANEFTYQYDRLSGLNTFRANIQFN